MMEIVKFKKEHLERLMERGSNQHLKEFVTSTHAAALEACEHAYSVFIDGRILLSGGVSIYWEGRGEAWAVFDPDCRHHFLKIHNAVRRFLEICPVRRIEATVDDGFQAGHRWVKALGFKCEAEKLKAYRLKGLDSSLYARVS